MRLSRGLAALQVIQGEGVPIPLIIQQLANVNAYNRTKVMQTFRAAIGVDIRPFLTEAAVNAHMVEAIAANVDLIKTIPPRFHEGLRTSDSAGIRGSAV